ncbi:MAG: rhodanese-like domain-containing protein [Alphaproteobacteria bacterium]|nr:rhodanese-like domain-containing protein [Alphaproteobacteria bacterium]
MRPGASISGFGPVHRIVITLVVVILLTSAHSQASDLASSVDPTRLSEHRKTGLGLYLTSKDAHDALTRDPSILFIDVRTPAEFGLVGHPVEIDRNIPFAFLGTSVNPNFGQYGFVRNPHFVSQVEDYVTAAGGTRSSAIILICRSGSRSRHSVNFLAEAGFSRVWHVVDGFEGRGNRDGHRVLEGWRHEKLPWKYAIGPGQAHVAVQP